ncbi:MAG: hypothetical protein JW882_03230, partial [Deltaproteobacteria bacterium]|nr:hypothetical protein [Deltaproteobacteria bacterium]
INISLIKAFAQYIAVQLLFTSLGRTRAGRSCLHANTHRQAQNDKVFFQLSFPGSTGESTFNTGL